MSAVPSKSTFPKPSEADSDGLLCYGGALSCEILIDAYSHGIFPWPQENLPLLWFSPPQRGVLDFADFHVPKRVQKTLRQTYDHEVTFDRDFAQVIRCCARAPRPGQNGTWLLPEMIEAYTQFHEAGYAHSVECWYKGELAGGLYGVYINGVFSGESMFHRESDASKRCLYALIEKLKKAGLTWIDTQMITPVVASFGGKYISREVFLQRLSQPRSPVVIDWSS
jgi:leucyl/phenylalanyl-tRNA--protein transferase